MVRCYTTPQFTLLRGRHHKTPVSVRVTFAIIRARRGRSERRDLLFFYLIPTLMTDRLLYRIIFLNQGKIYEIYARSIAHGDLFGFLEIEELVFGERSTVVVDPAEEKIKSEFAGVQRTYIPVHSVMRIDQVEKQGVSKISAVDGDNVTPFPMPMYTPGGPGGPGGGSGE